MGCRALPTVVGSPSMVVISSVGWSALTGIAHGLTALPLRWLVHALQTLMPQPYFGPVTPRMSRSTHSRRTSSATVTVTCSPLTRKVCSGTAISLVQRAWSRPSVGDCGMGGMGGLGVKDSVPWLIGKLVGIVAVARP